MTPTKPPTRRPWTFLTAGSFIEAAQATHPEFRIILAVAGIFGILVIFSKFGLRLTTLLLGALALLGLAIIYLVVAQATRLRRERLDLMASVVVWTVLVLIVATATCVIHSVFVDKPLPLRGWFSRLLMPQSQTLEDQIHNDPEAILNRQLVLQEVGEAYSGTWEKVVFFAEWANPLTPGSATVGHGVLTIISASGPSGCRVR